MLVKKLRNQKSWSQEQLATLAGVSLRTIQRVEAGNTASLETLKSLASVFEIEIDKLTEEITVLDKEAEKWESVPTWIRVGLWGLRSRKSILAFEYFCVAMGIIGFFGTFFKFYLLSLSLFWAGAYFYAIAIRWLDNNKMW